MHPINWRTSVAACMLHCCRILSCWIFSVVVEAQMRFVETCNGRYKIKRTKKKWWKTRIRKSARKYLTGFNRKKTIQSVRTKTVVVCELELLFFYLDCGFVFNLKRNESSWAHRKWDWNHHGKKPNHNIEMATNIHQIPGTRKKNYVNETNDACIHGCHETDIN